MFLPTPTGTPARSGTRRILVLANETLQGLELHDVVQASARSGGRVLVVAPALNTRLRHWLSDSDAARAHAHERLLGCIDALTAAGVDAEGMIGDGNPFQAALDALALFGADEIVVATHPEGRSHWLARGLVDRLCERTGLPILHVVVRPQPVPAARCSAGLRIAA